MLLVKYCEKTCRVYFPHGIIELSDRYEQAQLKPTNITIREFGAVIGVECLYLYKNPNDDV